MPAYWSSTVSRVESDTVFDPRLRPRGADRGPVVHRLVLPPPAGTAPDPGRGAGARRASSTRCSTTPCSSRGRWPPATPCPATRAWSPASRRRCCPSASTRSPRRTRLASSWLPTPAQVASGASPLEVAREVVATARSRKERIPGFGHPRFRRVDPRAQRLKEIAVAEGAVGRAGAAVRSSCTRCSPRSPARPRSPSTTSA